MSRLPILRTSERTSFKRCPQRWWWGYREGLRPQGPPNEKLWFGEGIHLALALYYIPGRKRGIDPRKTWRKFVNDDIMVIRTQFDKDYDTSAYVDAGPYGEALLDLYLQEYGDDSHWEIIAPEQKFDVLIPHPLLAGKYIRRLYGTFDGVFRDLDEGRHVKLLETKTAAQITIGHLELDDQRGTYLTVADHVLRHQGLITPDEYIVDMVYNFLRKGKVDDDRPKDGEGRFLNKDGSISKNQGSRLFLRHPVGISRGEADSQLERIGEEALAMDFMKDGTLMPWKHTTKDCSWDCEFYQMCVLDEGNPDDTEEFKRAVFRVEDPYATYRKSAAA